MLADQSTYIESEMLRRIAGGDAKSFESLFERYRHRCFSYALKITGSLQVAEDVVQEVFLNCWQIRAKLPEIENLNAYLHRMVHNNACTQLERVAREGLVLHFLKNSQSSVPEEFPEGLIAEEVRAYVLQLIDQLSPRQREVFILSREHELKYDEIADRLGIGYETVKTHLSEALKNLRKGLDDHFGENALAIIVIWQLTSL